MILGRRGVPSYQIGGRGKLTKGAPRGEKVVSHWKKGNTAAP